MSKIWGIGNGRSGTSTLAFTRGGLHEPRPWLTEEATQYYWGDRHDEVMEPLVRKLAARMRGPVELIVDHKQSYVIPLICELDQGAEFIWLLREPEATVKSFMGFGFYTRKGGEWDWSRVVLDMWRPRPRAGWPDDWIPETKCFWLWYETNRVIEKDLKETGAPYEMILCTPEELGPKKYNPMEKVIEMQKDIQYQPFKPKPDRVLDNPQTLEFYETYAKPLYDELVGSRNREARAQAQ